MKTNQTKLSKREQQQVYADLMKDCRVIELYKTRQERPLNLLEQIMLDQILKEYGAICKRRAKGKSIFIKLTREELAKAFSHIERNAKNLPPKKARRIVGAYICND